ncbi:MAG: hypothetical protein HDR94_04775 [Bacteroides sp.]|nr:hypothetical protein [Bacteroides sp.]
MKLGYIYTVTSGGYDDEKVRINAGDWSSVVEDERQLWLKFSDNGESTAMTIVRDGVVFAITRMIGGDRADNNITTWVYIPSKVKITGSQVKQVIDAIKEINKLGTKKVSQNSFMSIDILAYDYPEKKYAILLSPSEGKELAGRYPTTDFSMVEILGHSFQEYYTKYKYVFLFNQKNEFKEGLVDLSNQDIIDTICVLPPSADNIQKIFGSSSVVIKLSDGSVFNTPFVVKKGQPISLTAVKKDCIPMRIMGQAFKDEAEIEISSINQPWKRIISNLFEVTDAKTGKVIPSKCRILDSHYDELEKSIPEDRLRNVRIQVTSNGYEPFDGEVNLSHGVKTIPLEKIMEKETYTYQTKAGDDVKVTISGPGAKSKSPLQGYKVNGHKLIYVEPTLVHNGSCLQDTVLTVGENTPKKRRFAWMEFCYGIISVILLMFILYGGIKFFHPTFFKDMLQYSKEYSEDITIDDSDVNMVTPTLKDTAKEQAIAYLDNQTGKWDRDSFNRYPVLECLFEELNTYQFDKILNRESILSGSRNFKDVLDAIRINKHKKFSGSFCPENDFQITVSRYIDKLNKPEEQKAQASSEGIARKAAIDAQDSKRTAPKQTDQASQRKANENKKKKRGNEMD